MREMYLAISEQTIRVLMIFRGGLACQKFTRKIKIKFSINLDQFYLFIRMYIVFDFILNSFYKIMNNTKELKPKIKNGLCFERKVGKFNKNPSE